MGLIISQTNHNNMNTRKKQTTTVKILSKHQRLTQAVVDARNAYHDACKLYPKCLGGRVITQPLIKNILAAEDKLRGFESRQSPYQKFTTK